MNLLNMLKPGQGFGKKIRNMIIKSVTKNVIIVSSAVLVVTTVFDYTTEVIHAENTPKKVYDTLEVSSIDELVTIKEDGKGGYYFDFVDGIDEKIKKLISESASESGVRALPTDVSLVKKMLKADMITEFPNLGGEIPENSEGFQGAVKIRRVTPNKNMGELKNTGRGETTAIEHEEASDTVELGDYENAVKEWKAGKKLTLRNNSILYKQKESEINKGTYIENYWETVKIEGTGKDFKISKGKEVEYTGKYVNSKEEDSTKVITYVEIKYKDKTGFIKAKNTKDVEDSKKEDSKKEDSKKENSKKETSSITRVTNKTASIITSRAKEKKKTAGEKNKEYVIAIAAGHNNSDNHGAHNGNLKEEELTIKVAEKVEELFKDYSNIKVVQTGSTSSNPGGIKIKQRTKLARDAKPALCIQIHFNAGGGTGVEAIYKDGDEYSAQLAEILSRTISDSMGIKNRKAGTDLAKSNKSLGIIESYAKSGFPSVVTEGGFIDGDAKLVGSNEGIEKYAKGIVNGVVEYLGTDHSGLSATYVDSSTVTDSINSIVKNLKYVPKEKMDEYIKNANKEALNVFTLDEENKVITATWSESGDASNPKIEITTNAAMDLKTALQKYSVPYEYLLMFYIDTDDEKFLSEFADLILKTDIVMVLQDNIVTTSNKDTKEEKSDPAKPGESADWKDTNNVKKTLTESVSTSVDFTYINAWCVKAYKTNSYSDKALNIGDKDEIEIDIPGKVNESDSSSLSAQKQVRTDEVTTVEETIDSKGQKGTTTKVKKYKIYQRTRTETKTISNTYDSGELKIEESSKKFIKIYKDNIKNLVREDYLFEIIEENEKTANYLNLTKYLIYKATGEDYGVVEYNFDEFGINSFSGMTNIYGNTVQEKVWFALRGAGYSEEATAGVMGNIEAESGFDPSKVEAGYGNNIERLGIGLVQWTNNGRGSEGGNTNLRKYAESIGKSWTDADVQIEFLLANLAGGGCNGYAGRELYNNTKGYYGKNYYINDWLNATNPEDAAETFMAIYERPSAKAFESSKPIRRAAARKYYEQFKGQTAPTIGGEMTLTGENASKMVALINEAVRIANDDRYTYSQSNRFGDFQYDCSSFVYRLYKEYFGIQVPASTSGYGTQNRIGEDGKVTLQPGDVLWRSGHVEMYIGNGQRVGAHSAKLDIKDQISIKGYKAGNFTYVYRFVQ